MEAFGADAGKCLREALLVTTTRWAARVQLTVNHQLRAPAMSLRRVAQANHAMASPRSSFSSSSASQSTMTSPTTPDKEKIFPVTPRQPRTSHHQIIRSPLLSPSLSEVRPFDWEAAKSNRPPPYASPVKSKSRRQSTVPNGALGSPTKGPGKRVVRKKSLYEKCVDAFPLTFRQQS